MSATVVSPTVISPTVISPSVAGPTVAGRPTVSARALRPLLGAPVVVRTPSALWRGTLLSCVRDSAWFVVNDEDVVVHMDDLVSVHAA
jgi:hypothetical protein